MNTNKKQSAMQSDEATEMLPTPGAENISSTANTKKKSNLSAAAAGAAGGFVAGAAAGAATSAAAIPAEIEDVVEVSESEESAKPEAPEAENVLLVNDEGVRVAHVDANSFSEAFAQARQQVGPGGVFEYRGQIYGTYYDDEWNNMSAAERADYQQRVSGVAPSHHDYAAQSGHHAESHASTEQMASNTQMVDVEPVDDSSVHVLGVDKVDGMIVARIESDGDHAMLVDLDSDGIIDVMIYDENGDGVLQESEYFNVSNSGITVENLEHMQAAQNGNLLYASHDDMPDYVNDADMIMNA